MISHEHRCIFVHVPKTGGTSIAVKLGLLRNVGRGTQDHRRIRDVDPRTFRNVRRLLLGGRGRGRETLSRRMFDAYHKFAFVRNPWDRVFSWYRGIVRDPVHQAREGVPPTCTFPDYVARHMERCWALHSQLYWIANSGGDVCVDFVGRYERLQDDFAVVCEALGIPDTTLPHVNSGYDDPTYAAAYDAVSRDRVARRYRDEIDRFGYEFGA